VGIEKDPTVEMQMETFLRMLEKDKEIVPFLIRFIERMVYDTMSLGERGFQPVLAMTLFVKRGLADNVEIILRPVRTTSQETYEAFRFERLAELLNDAFGQYGVEVWGMSPIPEVAEMRINGNKMLSQWGDKLKGEDK